MWKGINHISTKGTFLSECYFMVNSCWVGGGWVACEIILSSHFPFPVPIHNPSPSRLTIIANIISRAIWSEFLLSGEVFNQCLVWRVFYVVIWCKGILLCPAHLLSYRRSSPSVMFQCLIFWLGWLLAAG